MAKGQKRSNREAKKPKQPKSEKTAGASLVLMAERAPVANARISSRDGRR
jgi:hypothetical protein